MSLLAKVVPYFSGWLQGGLQQIPRLKRCRFLRAPSIESFMVGFFGKLMDGTVAKKFFFQIFFLRIFSQPPKKWLIFWKSTIFHIFRSGDFCVQQTHPKTVTNRKYRSVLHIHKGNPYNPYIFWYQKKRGCRKTRRPATKVHKKYKGCLEPRAKLV